MDGLAHSIGVRLRRNRGRARIAVAITTLVLGAAVALVLLTRGGGPAPDAAALARLVFVDAKSGERVEDARVVLVDADGRCHAAGDAAAPAQWSFAIVRAPDHMPRLVKPALLRRALAATVGDVNVALVRAHTLDVAAADGATLPKGLVLELTRPLADDLPRGFIFPPEAEAGRLRDRARAELATAGESGARLVDLPRMKTWFAHDLASADDWRARLPSERRALRGSERFTVQVPERVFWEFALHADEPFTVDGHDELAARRTSIHHHSSSDLALRVREVAHGTIEGAIALPGPGRAVVRFMRRVPNPSLVVGADPFTSEAATEVEEVVHRVHLVDGESFRSPRLAIGSYVADIAWSNDERRERLLERHTVEVAEGAVTRLDLAAGRWGRGVPIEFVCVAGGRVVANALAPTAQIEFALARRGDAPVDEWDTLVTLAPRERVRLFGIAPGPIAVWIMSPPADADFAGRWRIRPHGPRTFELPPDGEALVLEVELEEVFECVVEFEVSARPNGSNPFVVAACCRAGDDIARRVGLDFEPAGEGLFLARARFELPVGRWHFVASIPQNDDARDTPIEDAPLLVQRCVRHTFEITSTRNGPLVMRPNVELGCSFRLESSAFRVKSGWAVVHLRPTDPAELAALSLWSEERHQGDDAPLLFGGLLPGVTYTVEPLGTSIGPLEPGEERFIF